MSSEDTTTTLRRVQTLPSDNGITPHALSRHEVAVGDSRKRKHHECAFMALMTRKKCESEHFPSQPDDHDIFGFKPTGVAQWPEARCTLKEWRAFPSRSNPAYEANDFSKMPNHVAGLTLQVDLLKCMHEGAPQVKLASLSSGDIFGESAMIEGGSRSATVRCATQVQARQKANMPVDASCCADR